MKERATAKNARQAYKLLRVPPARPLTFACDSNNCLRVQPDGVDRIVREEWAEVYRGSKIDL
eukprot:8574677-Alexandrium_andersonii.AAC.1